MLKGKIEYDSPYCKLLCLKSQFHVQQESITFYKFSNTAPVHILEIQNGKKL